MTDNATAQALAGETPVESTEAPDNILEAPEAPAPSDDGLDGALEAVWAKHHQDESATETPQEAGEGEKPTETPEKPEAPSEAATEGVKAPYDLPKEFNELWPDLSEAQREVVAKTYRESANKWGEIGRQVKGIEPIRDVLVRAAEEMPALKGMTPEAVASEMFTLAQWAQKLNADPQAALSELAQKHGVTLNGAEKPPANATEAEATIGELRAHIAKLEKQVEQASNPEFIANHVSAVTAQQRLQEEINSFASGKEHWSAVEPNMPAAIQFVRGTMGENASATDVLSAAYDLAVSQIAPSPKAPQPAAAQAAPPVDPAKAKEAKSINIRSDAPASKAPMTERQVMESVWAKHHA